MRKLVKFCSILKFLEQEIDDKFVQTVKDLCLESLFVPHKNAGLTFIIPTKEARDKIMNLAYTDKIGESVSMIKAHVIFRYLPITAFSQNVEVTNALHQKLEVVSVKNTNGEGYVQLKTAIIKPNNKFIPNRFDNMSVWDVVNGSIPIDLPQAKMIKMELKTGGNSLMHPKKIFANDISQYEKYLLDEFPHNMLLERLLSYMCYMFKHHREEYFADIFPYLDPSEVGYFTTIRMWDLNESDWLDDTHGISIAENEFIRRSLTDVYNKHVIEYYRGYDNPDIMKKDDDPLNKMHVLANFIAVKKKELNGYAHPDKAIEKLYKTLFRSDLAPWIHSSMCWGRQMLKQVYSEPNKIAIFEELVAKLKTRTVDTFGECLLFVPTIISRDSLPDALSMVSKKCP